MSDRIAFFHSLRRTSPLGQSFVGVCVNCGKTGVTLSDAQHESCPNLRQATEDESLIEAITGRVQ